MKQKLKFILLLLFAGSMLFLQSCEKDLYEEPIYKEHSLLIQRKNFADIQKRPQLLNKIENVCKKKVNAQGKMIYDSIKQIYIDLDDVMYIKDSVNTETYTFKILRDGEEKIENLVVSVKSNGETESYLIKYFQEILSTYATNQESIKEELKQYSEVYLVDDNLYQNLQKINYDDCTEVVQVQINVPGVRCHSGQHDATDGELCNYWGTSWEATLGGTEFAYVTLHYDCGGGGGGGFSTGPHGVGGGGGFGGTPPDPWDKVKKILASPPQLPTNVSGAISIKQAIINLQNQVDNATQEQGYSMAYNSTTGQMYAYPASTGYQDNMVVYDPQSNVFGGVHFHFDALQPMFSHDDIPVLYNFMIRFTEPNTSPTIY